MKLYRRFEFGPFDYNGTGRKDYRATVEVELRGTENGPEFSACGAIKYHGRSWVCGGQCLDEIAKHVKVPVFKEIYRLWTLYHLNGMNAECEHQRALGWKDQAAEKIEFHHFDLSDDVREILRAAEQRATKSIARGETFTPTAEETRLANLPRALHLPTDELPAEYAADYKPCGKSFSDKRHVTTERRGWVRYDEDERGLLCKPCPVCGYGYGTAWKYAAIPDDDLARIKSLLGAVEEVSA